MQLLSVPDFTPVSTFADHSDVVTSLAFSPDGSILAAGTKDGEIWLWNVSDSTQLTKLSGHNGQVSQIFFTPDGTRLISISGNYSGAGDATIRLWGLRP